MDKTKVILVLIIIILLVGLAIELSYIESMLTNAYAPLESKCKSLCLREGRVAYIEEGVCNCKEPITFERNWRCFSNVTFTEDETFSKKFNASSVRNIAVSSVVRYEKPNTFATKVFSIYNRVAERIFYVSDPRQDEYIASPKETWEIQGGDCDDTSILLSSLYEAIGLDANIVEVWNETYGHVFVIVQVEQDLETFLDQYRRLVERHTKYSGKIPFNFIVFEENEKQCKLTDESLKSGKSVSSFYVIIESIAKGYAGNKNPFEGFENRKFIEIGS
jgi:hypothetical protein